MLLFPDFVLLEDINPASIDDLLEIIKGVSEMAAEGGELGVGYQRIGYRSRWGVVGEIDSDWTYQQVLENNSNTHGIYFSPQQMIALSQRQPSPKYDRSKSDVFAFGIMLLEIVFQESLASIYDYTNFEILLNPLLEKLQRVKEEEGESLAAMFIAMLEIEEEDRVDFAEVLDLVDAMIKPQPKALPQLSTYMLNSNNSQRMDQSRGTKGANRANGYATQLTPKAAGEGNYRNDVSPFRGRFGANVKVPDRLKLTPERSPQSRSPMRQGKTPRQDLFGRATAFPQGGDYQ